MTRRFVRAIDLADDPEVIAAYDAAHRVGETPPPYSPRSVVTASPNWPFTGAAIASSW